MATNAQQTQSGLSFSSNIGNLIRLLPTGTVFFYQLINPVLTNYGHCHVPNKILTAIVVSLSGLFCIVVTFTDSYKGSDGGTHYAFVTHKGLWPAPTDESVTSDKQTYLKKYKIRAGDFGHAFLSAVVFVLVVLFDRNTVECFFPSLESQKTLLATLPAVVGLVSSVGLAFSVPQRNWFGYPPQLQDGNLPNPVNVDPANKPIFPIVAP